MRSSHYSGSIDGDIREYLREMRKRGVTAPTFKGPEPYVQLWELGIMVPYLATIRLSRLVTQELYYAVDKTHVEGFADMMYAGKIGVHDAEGLLKDSEVLYWEVGGLDPGIYRR